MKFNFTKGDRLILELSDKNVFEGSYDFGTNNQIDLINVVDLETRNPIQARLTFYQHEIVSVKIVESQNGCKSDLNNSDSTNTTIQDSSNVIKLPRDEYDRLQTMTQNFLYFATADKRYVEAIAHLNNCENIGVVGLGLDFGPTKPIDLLVMCSWDQVYIFDLFSYQYANFPADLKDLLESPYIKKVGHNLLKLVESLWYCHRVCLKNIFDTQLADIEVEKKNVANHETQLEPVTMVMKRSLSECLRIHLNFPSSVIEEAGDVTSSKWKERPLTNSRKIKASLLAVYLITLKNTLERTMLKEFYGKLESLTENVYKCSTYQACVKFDSDVIKNGVKNVCIE
ncbi:hypothetical protein RN001_003247 [Aquatica leii]|uniref:3'-5' exonuclease domain-containing protein n=1 Tax=Aquatica leii TaxID=1421715 RepID=A0AAN7PNE8_9COLE|nr:hypothetical protein RN001_003247 [Aquatica leii]